MFATSIPTNPIYRAAGCHHFYYFANSGIRTTSFSRQFHNKKKTNKQTFLVWSTWNIKRTGPVFFFFLFRVNIMLPTYYPTDAAALYVRLICINCSSTAFSPDAGCRPYQLKSSASIHKRRGLKTLIELLGLFIYLFNYYYYFSSFFFFSALLPSPSWSSDSFFLGRFYFFDECNSVVGEEVEPWEYRQCAYTAYTV